MTKSRTLNLVMQVIQVQSLHQFSRTKLSGRVYSPWLTEQHPAAYTGRRWVGCIRWLRLAYSEAVYDRCLS